MRDDQLRLLWVARVDYPKGSEVEAHSHRDHSQLLAVISGAGEIEIDGVRCKASEGHAYLFLPGVSHRFRFSADTITVDFKFRNEAGLDRALRNVPPYRRCASKDLSDLKRWHQLSVAARSTRNPYSALRIEAGFKGTLLSVFLMDAEGSASSAGSYEDIDESNPFVTYLKDRLAEPVTLERVAGHFGFHPNYFIERFRERTGLTPMRYLQEARLEKAREYLQFTAWPIAEVAERVGWSVPYLSKMIKKKFGAPPLAYRKSLIESIGEDIVMETDFRNEWRITLDSKDAARRPDEREEAQCTNCL